MFGSTPFGTTPYCALANSTISKDALFLWSTLQRLTDNSIFIWDVKKNIEDSSNFLWNTKQSTINTITPLWHARAIITDSSQIVWNVRKLIEDNLSLDWNIFQSKNKDLELIWYTDSDFTSPIFLFNLNILKTKLESLNIKNQLISNFDINNNFEEDLFIKQELDKTLTSIILKEISLRKK